MSVGGLLVERDGRTLLIDAGFGAYTGDTPAGPVNSGALLDILGSLGLHPAEIDTVAFTHLYVDHTGWAFTPFEACPLVDTGVEAESQPARALGGPPGRTGSGAHAAFNAARKSSNPLPRLLIGTPTESNSPADQPCPKPTSSRP